MSMSPDRYQDLAARTIAEELDPPLTPKETMIVWAAIGIGGEGGEVIDLIKKGIFHRHGLDLAKIAEEIGDSLWYHAALATSLGLSLGEIMAANVEKLKDRYPDGYSAEASANRQGPSLEADMAPLMIAETAQRLAMAAPELLAALKVAYQYAPRHWQTCKGYMVGDDLTIFDDRENCTCYIGQMMKAIEQADPSAVETKRAT